MARLPLLCLALLLSLIVGGCAGGGGGNGGEDPTVRFLNGVPDSTQLEFLLNSEVSGTPLAFLASSPNFVSFEPEFFDVSVRETGVSQELWAEVMNFESDNDYLVVAHGLENFGTETEKRVQLLQVDVDRQAPNGSRSRVYVLHGYHRQTGFQTPAIDFQNPGQNPQFSIEEIEPGEVDSFVIDSGNHDFDVLRSGTENVLISTNVNLDPGKVYLALVVGVENGVGPQAPQVVLVELQTEP